MSEANYNASELLICLAGRLVEDGSMAFIGTGIPMLAASLAQKRQAPNMVPIFEFGGLGAQLEKLPLAVGDMRTFNRAMVASSICEVMETAQRGFIEYGFIGGAQIDMYGNLNSTVIGPQDKPKVRLPGSGGANDIGSLIWRTIAIMRHDVRRFVDKLDFLTTPGYLSGPGAREAAGLPANTGPYRVVSNLGIMGFDEATKRMMLLSTNPGVTVEQVLKNTGFELLVADEVTKNEPPSDEELRILREDVDPDGLYR
jgi:glutaconate CoA-transferase, subunit B